MKDADEKRFEELLVELSECREDERNSQNMIVQVVSVAGTILGIFLGASIWESSGTSSEMLVITGLPGIWADFFTKSRLLFVLSNLVFCTAFMYITVIGIGNVMRYYYIQDLEDRVYHLLPAASDDNSRTFIHWGSYYGPIVTRNLRHLTSAQSVLNYICYSAATLSAILFSFVVTFVQYFRITPKEAYDVWIMGIPVVLMFFSAALFLYSSSQAKKASIRCRNVAENNRDKRETGKDQDTYSEAASFWYFIKYLVYPKKQDKQKPVLIFLGFVVCVLYHYGWSAQIIQNKAWGNLLLCWIVFDVLAYQARYQINDLRGMDEDEESVQNQRLMGSGESDAKGKILVSLATAVVKIVAAVGITFFCEHHIGAALRVFLFLLFVITVVYEWARDHRNAGKYTWLIWLSVGLGYPLRVAVGMFAACPYELTSILFRPSILLLLAALWFFGIFSSVLTWADEVSKRMQRAKAKAGQFPSSYAKPHFLHIQNKIIDMYTRAEYHMVNGRVLPLRERGFNIWDQACFLSMICLTLSLVVYGNVGRGILLTEIIIDLLMGFICIWASGIQIAVAIGLVVVLIIFKGIYAGLFCAEIFFPLLICAVQLLFIIVYFLLRYIPQLKKVTLLDLLERPGKIFLGEYTWQVLMKGWGDSCKKNDL